MSDNTTLDLTDLTNSEEQLVHGEINDDPEPEEPTIDDEPEDEPEESTIDDEPEDPTIDDEPEEESTQVESTPSVQEVASNIKEILTSDTVEENLTEKSLTTKIDILINIIVRGYNFDKSLKNELSNLEVSTASDKLNTLIDTLTKTRLKHSCINKLISIRNDSESSIQTKLSSVIDIVVRINTLSIYKPQLFDLK